jgi:serine-type D-Ala-D-Ala carboxypeptidase/endopeptidase (penicillin-binding protein 4)
MMRYLLFISSLFISLCSFSQKGSIEKFLSDSSLVHASVSICVEDADSGTVILEYNSGRSLIPASIQKLITSGIALELLGPGYTFKTSIGYSGTLNKRTGKLSGDIIIKGGGDPSLGSEYFTDHYQDFISNWVSELKKAGIKKISGRVVTDDSYYDFIPVPDKWLWEDEGNYYGAGVYGLSVFDNKYKIHFKTGSEHSLPVITGFSPPEAGIELKNFLVAEGTTDNGYVFSTPYSSGGWIKGTIPVNHDDFILNASITDPPLIAARLLHKALKASGIAISGSPSTLRLEQNNYPGEYFQVAEIISPPLSEIELVLNHESVNLYAETLLKELGKKYRNSGSSAAGIEVVMEFLQSAGIQTNGIFMEDGCGLSPLNAISSSDLVNFLIYMKSKGKYFPEYYSSLPAAGKEGTLKNVFTDPVFDGNLKAKSGSITRVRNYSGYFTTVNGKNMVFAVIVNNYSGTSRNIVKGIETFLKEIILTK